MSRHGILGVFALFAYLLLAWPSLAQQTQELWVARHDGPVSLNDNPCYRRRLDLTWEHSYKVLL
jgi:hypothetical protein